MHQRTGMTSLWNLVENLQHSLEQQGLAAEAVDAAVTYKIASIIDRLSASKLWNAVLVAARKRAPRGVELWNTI